MHQRERFAGQVAVVTGAAQGIGKAVAQRLVAEKCKVAFLDINESALQRTVTEFENQNAVLSIVIDVTKAEQVTTAIQLVIHQWTRIDILVTAAGITGKTNVKTHEGEVKDFEKVVQVNLMGVYLMCKYTLPHMLKQNYGRIVNFASIAGKEGNAGMAAYSSTKAAVIGLTKVIGKEYAETKITCNAIAPAVINTPMVAALPEAQVKYMTDKIPMKRTGTLEEIASLTAFVASPECSFTTGFTFDMSGGRATY